MRQTYFFFFLYNTITGLLRATYAKKIFMKKNLTGARPGPSAFSEAGESSAAARVCVRRRGSTSADPAAPERGGRTGTRPRYGARAP